MRMKFLGLIAGLLLVATSAQAENSILGKWNDKNQPSAHQYEFIKGHDFIYTHSWTHQGQARSSKSIGVWEIGSWKITKSNGSESSCNLTIYADTKECCFEFKFIANNLILTNKYSDGYGGSMCKNRVLVRSK
jgi:hypothetical protein